MPGCVPFCAASECGGGGVFPHASTAPCSSPYMHSAPPAPPCLSPAAAIFRLFDIDGDGFICRGDLGKLLGLTVGRTISPDAVEDIVSRTIEAADGDGDGRISYEDFEHVSASGHNLKIGQQSIPRVRAAALRRLALLPSHAPAPLFSRSRSPRWPSRGRRSRCPSRPAAGGRCRRRSPPARATPRSWAARGDTASAVWMRATATRPPAAACPPYPAATYRCCARSATREFAEPVRVRPFLSPRHENK